MDQVVRSFFILAIASSCSFCQELPVNYSATSIAGAGAGMCPATQDLRESIKRNIHSLINSVLPALMTQNQTQIVLGTGPGYGACGCGGTGWRRAAYLNMSDPTQTCPPAWELITTPIRSCRRPSNANRRSCYSAMFPTQGIQYSQVCGRIIGYQFGATQAFRYFIRGNPQTIDDPYVDGVSLTYGSPRQHIWTFAGALDEAESANPNSRCTCADPTQPKPVPSFVGDNYFCETGVPPGQGWRDSTFHADDPLWDGQGCSLSNTCCAFNNPPWFCEQLPRSTNADLEVRLCLAFVGPVQNTPIELIEIYVK